MSKKTDRADEADKATGADNAPPGGGAATRVTRPAKLGAKPPEGEVGETGHKVSRPVKWADDLMRELEASGTGQSKLDIIRRAKAEKYNRVATEKYGGPQVKGLDKSDPELHLSAEEAVRILESDDAVGEVTRAKARGFLERGEWTPRPAAAARPADADVPPPPEDATPAPVPEEPEGPDGGKPLVGEDAPKGTGTPYPGQRPLDWAPPPASADSAGVGKGTEPGTAGKAPEGKAKGNK